MDWNEGENDHGNMHDNCNHGNTGHSHSHGPRAPHPFMTPFQGQFANKADQAMDINQQPKRRSHMDDSASLDIVKATQFGILERCKELVDAGYDVRLPDKENVTLLHWAAINNRAELVKFYISKGSLVDQLGGDLNSSPLHWAIRSDMCPTSSSSAPPPCTDTACTHTDTAEIEHLERKPSPQPPDPQHGNHYNYTGPV